MTLDKLDWHLLAVFIMLGMLAIVNLLATPSEGKIRKIIREELDRPSESKESR